MRFIDGQRAAVKEELIPERDLSGLSAERLFSTELLISKLIEEQQEKESVRKRLSRLNTFFLAQFTAVGGFWAAVVPLSLLQVGHSFQHLGVPASFALAVSSYLYIVVNPAVPVDQMSYGWRIRYRGGRQQHIVLLNPNLQEREAIEANERLIIEGSRRAAEEAFDTRRFERDARRLRRKSKRFVRRGGL